MDGHAGDAAGDRIDRRGDLRAVDQPSVAGHLHRRPVAADDPPGQAADASLFGRLAAREKSHISRSSRKPAKVFGCFFRVFQHPNCRKDGRIKDVNAQRRLDFLILDHVVRLFDRTDVLDAVLIRLGVEVVQQAVFRRGLDVPKALRFFVKILRLVDDLKACLFHAGEVFAAEFSVVPDLGDLKAHLPHPHKPRDDLRVVDGLVVTHAQPAVLLPAEQRDVVLLGLDGRGRDREPTVRDNDVDALVHAVQAGRRQVVHLGQVGAAVPLDRQLCQLLDRPVIFGIRRPKLRDVKVGPHRGRVHVERLCKKVLALLRVVLRLQRVVHDVVRSDGLPVGGVSHPLHVGVGVVHVAGLVHRRRRDKDKQRIRVRGLDRAVEDLPAVLKPVAAKAVFAVAGRGDADDELVGVRLGCLLEYVVLLGRLVGMQLVGDDDVGVKTVLLVRIGCQRVDVDRSVADAAGDAALGVVVQDAPLTPTIATFIFFFC